MSLLYTNVTGANCPGTKVFHCGTPLPTPSTTTPSITVYTNTRHYYHCRSTISVLAEARTATPIIIETLIVTLLLLYTK